MLRERRRNLRKDEAYQFLTSGIESSGVIEIGDAKKHGVSKHHFYGFIKDNNLYKEKSGCYSVFENTESRYKVAQDRYPKIIYSWATALELHGATENICPEIYASIPSNYSINKNSFDSDFVFIRESEKTYGIGVEDVVDNKGRIVRAYSLNRCFCDFVTNKYFTLDTEQYYKFLHYSLSNGMIYTNETLFIAHKMGVFEEVYHTINLMINVNG